MVASFSKVGCELRRSSVGGVRSIRWGGGLVACPGRLTSAKVNAHYSILIFSVFLRTIIIVRIALIIITLILILMCV